MTYTKVIIMGGVYIYENKKYFKDSIMILLTCAILTGILPLKCFAQDNDEINFSTIDKYIENQMKSSHILGASIGIVKGDKLIYEKGYGNADVGKSVTPKTLFEIGSVTKSFTALAIMQLKEKGKIDLDSPIDKYLPWFKAYYKNSCATITVRQLLNQNSGVPTFFDNDVNADVSIEKVVKEHLNNMKLVNAPGTTFLYSNANYNILGEIVQAVSGQSYKEYINNNIFVPLEMKHSYVSKEEASKDGLAAGYRQWFGFPIKADLPYFQGNIPSGHIISCTDDMCHYLSIFMNEGKYKNTSILSPEGIKVLMEPSVKTLIPIGTDATEAYYAMGWGVNYKNGKIDTIEHTGETSNYHAHVIINPNEKIGVIEMDNLGGYITAGGIEPNILNITLNRQPSTSLDIGRISMIINVIYLAIAILLIIAILRLRHFKQRLEKSKFRFIFNLIFTLLVNLILPIVILLNGPTMLGGTTWNSVIIFSPDFSLVLIVTSIILFIISMIKAAIIITRIKNKLNIPKIVA